MSQTVVTILGVLGLLVFTLLLGTGFGADMDFSLRRARPASSATEERAPAARARPPVPATALAPARCDQP